MVIKTSQMKHVMSCSQGKMSSMSIAKTKSWNITTNQDFIRTWGDVPDPDWVFVDKKGHYHQWKKSRSKKDKDNWHVTNGKLVEYTYNIPDYCECCGAENETETTGYYWACARCGEKLYPEYRDENLLIPTLRQTTGTFITTEKYYRIPRKRFRLQAWLLPKEGIQLCGKGLVNGWEAVSGPLLGMGGPTEYEVAFTVIGKLTMKSVA